MFGSQRTAYSELCLHVVQRTVKRTYNVLEDLHEDLPHSADEDLHEDLPHSADVLVPGTL